MNHVEIECLLTEDRGQVENLPQDFYVQEMHEEKGEV
jgi:hypothetical protein